MTIRATKIPKSNHRMIWGFNPVSRVVPSKKIYSRKKYKNFHKEYE